MYLLLWLRNKKFGEFGTLNYLNNLFNHMATNAPMDMPIYSNFIEDFANVYCFLVCHMNIVPNSIKQ